jgi:hypothetical protein
MAITLDVSEMVPTKIQPKGKRHFIFAIEGVDSFLVKTAQRPTWTTEEVEIPWINSTRYMAGKTKFSTISVTLHDAIAPSANQQVMEWQRMCFESISGRGGYADFYKRDIQIRELDPVGNQIGLWDLKGCFITEANFGDLSYEGSDLMEISLTIRFDNCVLQY